MAWRPDDTRIVTTRPNAQEVLIWDAAAGKLLHNLKHPLAVGTVSWSPNGDRLVTHSHATRTDGPVNVVSVFDAHTGATLSTADVGAPVFSPDGAHIAATRREGDDCRASFFVHILDPATGATRHKLPVPSGIFAKAFSADSRQLAVGCETGERFLIDVVSGELRAIEGHADTVRWLQFTRNDGTLSSLSAEGDVLVTQLARGTSIRFLGGRARVGSR